MVEQIRVQELIDGELEQGCGCGCDCGTAQQELVVMSSARVVAEMRGRQGGDTCDCGCSCYAE